MRTTPFSSLRVFISSVLIASILSSGFIVPVFAQRPRPIVITFGQPNIWSLEQAHYLLARMHRQNLDLQTAALGSLDPNATNASRIDILKTLLQAGVSFDQAVGLNNELLRRDKVFDSDRRRQLLNNRTTLQSESTQLARDIAGLKIAKVNAANEAEATQIQDSIDAKSEQKAAVDNELTQTNDEVKNLSSASGNFTSAAVPEASPANIAGDLDTLISKVELINPSIAATLRLDNHIQMQYEIISKQLTLLRDEVGPGERLVFLELPQSISATQDRAEAKQAQTWWRIAGYTKVDKDMIFRMELNDLLQQITAINTEFTATEGLLNRSREHRSSLRRKLDDACGNKTELEVSIARLNDELAKIQKKKARLQEVIEAANESVKKAATELAGAIKSGNRARIRKAQAQLAQAKTELAVAQQDADDFDRSQELRCQKINDELKDLADKLDQLEKTIAETRESIQKIDGQNDKLDKDYARLLKVFTSLSTKYDKLRIERIRQEVREKQDAVDRLLQGGGMNTSKLVDDVIKILPSQTKLKEATYSYPTENARKRCDEYAVRATAVSANCEPRSFVNLEEDYKNETEVRRRTVRTIDIIPRQNAINVQDTKQRVARTGIFAAVSFLFGFAGKFTYERQREQAEQFLNQELFTSGFGKGEKDFGWNFYPFAGTKQLASGVRTTYAIAVIPEEAETLVLKARGCYFPRKDNQPLDYYAAGQGKWTNENRVNNAQCTAAEQVFVVPVPGGSGDGADYYVTDLRYSAFQEPGSRMVVSIFGQNLPSQVGVLIDGVPLREAVGLGQLNIESILGDDKTRDNCVGPICGRFERIDANEIVASFAMGPDYEGTPRIGLIGPGRSLELNKLNLTINSQEDVQLDSADHMFGAPPDPTLRRITDFKVAPPAPAQTKMTGVLTGSRFKPADDKIFVNGSEAEKMPTCRKDLCIVQFEPQETDYLTVTISPADPAEKAVSKTYVNPTNLSIISASVVSFEPEQASRPALLTVKLDGSGFKEDLQLSIIKSEGPAETPKKIVASAGEMFLKIARPEAVVHINVKDPANNRDVSAIVVRPEPPAKEKKADQ